MNTQTKIKELEIRKQILQDKIDKLKQEEIKLDTLEIEGFTITKPKVCKTYGEAKKCPKGFRLPTRWELFKIFEKMENRKLLSDGGYMFFWSSLIEGDYVKGLFLGRYLNLNSYDDGLAGSNEYGRVVFVREKLKVIK